MKREFPNKNLLFVTDVGAFIEVAIVDPEANVKMEAFIAKTDNPKIIEFLKVTTETKEIDYGRTIMSVEKEDLVSMVLGTSPCSSDNHPLLKKYGRHIGGFVSKWYWDKSALEKTSTDKLLEIYNTVKTL